MQLVFKIIEPNPRTPNEVGDSNYQNHYTGVNRSMLWKELMPIVRQATQKFIIPFIGQPYYDYLAGKYINDAALSPEEEMILEALQDAVAHYTAYHALPDRNGFLTSMGVTQNTPTEGSGQPINQWGWKAKRWAALENGDTFLDKLLALMEYQVNIGNPAIDLWKNDRSYTAYSSVFFRRTDDMDAYINMQASRRAFMSLIKYFKQVEQDAIKGLTCDALFETLNNQIGTGSLTTANANLTVKIKRAIAYLGLAAAIPHHRVVVAGDGFTFRSSGDGFDDSRNTTNSQHSDAINSLKNECEKNGNKLLGEVKSYLAANADLYPLWRDSACNQQITGKSHGIVVPCNGIGGIGVF